MDRTLIFAYGSCRHSKKIKSVMGYKYYTIDRPAEALFKDKGSKFLAFAYPVSNHDDIKRHLNVLQEHHPKAVHHCYAYRLGLDGEDYRANDDGEPSGSAGRPILGQIISMNVTNVLVVVVRYFGGVLLGVPGLIHAYKMSTQEALSMAEVIEKSIMISGDLHCDYNSLGEILSIIRSVDGEVLDTDMAMDCHILFRIPLEQQHIFDGRMEKFYNIAYALK